MKFDDTPSKEEREDFWLDLGPASAYEGLDCCETARRDGTGRAEVEPEVFPLFPAGGIIEFHSISLLICIKVPPSGHALCSFFMEGK